MNMASNDNFTVFDCCECKRRITRTPALTDNEPRLCAECMHIPGWYTDPKLVDMLDPEYGHEK